MCLYQHPSEDRLPAYPAEDLKSAGLGSRNSDGAAELPTAENAVRPILLLTV